MITPMITPDIKAVWDGSSLARKRQIVQVALAREKKVHSDTIQENTVIGCNAGIELKLGMLVRKSIYTTDRTTFGQLLKQLGLN